MEVEEHVYETKKTPGETVGGVEMDILTDGKASAKKMDTCRRGR
jgi:hypothetical protein